MRQLIKLSSLIVIFSMNAISTSGQSLTVASKELTWHCGELTDKSNSKRIVSQHRLVTHGQASIDLHRGNEQKLTFKILSIKGEWGSENEDGILVYQVRYATDALGKVTVERKGRSVKALIDFTQGNKNGLNVEFTVDKIE